MSRNLLTRRFACCLLVLPVIAAAQAGRAGDSLRRTADTMHFPVPFTFKNTGEAQVSQSALFNRCATWADGITDSMPSVIIRKNAKTQKITIANAPAAADISCTVTIEVKGKQYSCLLSNYIFHPIDGSRVPLEKAAQMKNYQPTVNIEKLLITRNYSNIFHSLTKFVNKPG